MLRALPAVFLLPTILFANDISSASGTSARFTLPDSINDVVAGGGTGHPHVTRALLTPSEQQAPIHIVVSLQMRRAFEFHSRLDRGDKISTVEMESLYLPLQSDYDRIADWLKAEGFSIGEPIDPNRLNISASHTVANVARVFQVKFARVASAEGEFTSAVTKPSIPSQHAAVVLGVMGLQPHIHFRKHTVLVKPFGSRSSLAPADIRAAYNMPATLTGAGQTIAVIMEGPSPLSTNLTMFWNGCGVTQQKLSNITNVTVDGGCSTGDDFEESIDVEWASGMAPNAAVRFYNIPDLSGPSIIDALTRIAADRLTIPGLNVVTMSFGGSEFDYFGNVALTFHSILGVLANEGVTVFASSGDGGSNPDDYTNNYISTAPLAAEYPASDTYVTGVGGTDLALNSGASISSETSWYLDTGANATGGGISSIFGRPSWQTGSGISGSWRMVPDVAAMASDVSGVSQYPFAVAGGGVKEQGTGTSFSSPMWAGICACINQARATAGQPPMGVLGPFLYPLLGGSCFNAISHSGTESNGAYVAGAGYDLLTGLGSPNITNLVSAVVVANGDFNRDGNLDILWQNTSNGNTGIYMMNGTSFSSWSGLGFLPLEWQVKGSGHFTGSTSTDILWQDSITGGSGIYTMNGTTFGSWVDFGTNGTPWRIVGSGDFNGDGKPDVIWENPNTGDAGIYLMNGTTPGAFVSLGNLSTQWEIVGTGDFNHDGQTDIVMQNIVTGDSGIYLMNGTTLGTWVDLGTHGTPWRIMTTGDYDGDGNVDLVFENPSTCDCGVFLMNGTATATFVDIGVAGPGWVIRK